MLNRINKEIMDTERKILKYETEYKNSIEVLKIEIQENNELNNPKSANFIKVKRANEFKNRVKELKEHKKYLEELKKNYK